MPSKLNLILACARALHATEIGTLDRHGLMCRIDQLGRVVFNPLRNDTHLMLLVRSFPFKIDTYARIVSVQGKDYGWDTVVYRHRAGLNSAVCQCIYKMVRSDKSLIQRSRALPVNKI